MKYILKKGKIRQMRHTEQKNEFSLEIGIEGQGPELRITDWPEYHCSFIRIDKDNNFKIKEQVISALSIVFGAPTILSTCRIDNSTSSFRHSLYSFKEFVINFTFTKIYFYSYDYETLLKIEGLLKEFVIKHDNKQVYLLVSCADGITLSPSKYINEPLIYTNYEKEVSEALKKALKWSQEKQPRGRILIMSGPPGTGKSYAIRGLISESTGVDWALIPSYLVPELSSPSVIASLINERSDQDRPLNLIVEDADNLLKRREENNADIISQVLNLGDGILGELVNIKLIMTTNCPRVQIDKAVTRQGRLNAFIDFKLLPKEQAQIIYKNLCNRDIIYSEDKALCDIYAEANNEELIVPKKEITGNYL